MKKPLHTAHSRPIVPLNHINDPSGCCMAIDLFIESIVCGRSSARAMIIDGPIGSGKRQVALAAAAEFGTTVHEIEPNALVSRDELAALLDQVGPEGVLVVHNFDELPAKAQLELCLLITTGHALERRNPYSDAPGASSLRTELESPRMVIATTNALAGMPHPMVQSLPCFALRRHRDSIRGSLERRLRAASASCDADVLAQLVNLIFLAPSDRFETVATVLIGQADRCADRAIDAQVGERLIGMCWALMPTAEMVTAMRSAAEEQRIDDPDYPGLAEQLGVPATLRPEVCRAAEQPEEGGRARRFGLPPSSRPGGPDTEWWPE